MKRVQSIVLIIISTLILSMIGCANEKDSLNQTEVVDVKEEEISNKELKMISKEEYPINGENMDSVDKIYFTSKGSIILENRLFFQMENAICRLSELELREGEAKALRNESKKAEDPYDIRPYYMDKLENNKVKIYNKLYGASYIIEDSLIMPYYDARLLDNILVLPNHTKGVSKVHVESLKCVNLNDNSTTEIKFDKPLDINISKKLGNRLYILYSTELGVEYKSNLIIANLDTGKIEADIKINPASFVEPIDDSRILIEKGSVDSDYTLSIYNIESKTYKGLMTWKVGTNWIIYPMASSETVNLAPSRDKILYGEIKDNSLYLKVSQIQGMSLSEPIEVYKGAVSDPIRASFSEDGKFLAIVKALDTNSITVVKFNK